jgi:hypothetical protein
MKFYLKPHPLIKTQHYLHVEWAQSRADEYLNFWKTNNNTTLDDVDCVELYNSQDAMIHDICSF